MHTNKKGGEAISDCFAAFSIGMAQIRRLSALA